MKLFKICVSNKGHENNEISRNCEKIVPSITELTDMNDIGPNRKAFSNQYPVCHV
jgi:hypothetical protein